MIVVGAEEERIMDWLSPAKIPSRHNNVKELRTPGTGQWLLDSDKYKNWRHSSRGFLWLYGSGKFAKKAIQEQANWNE